MEDKTAGCSSNFCKTMLWATRGRCDLDENSFGA